MPLLFFVTLWRKRGYDVSRRCIWSAETSCLLTDVRIHVVCYPLGGRKQDNVYECSFYVFSSGVKISSLSACIFNSKVQSLQTSVILCRLFGQNLALDNKQPFSKLQTYCPLKTGLVLATRSNLELWLVEILYDGCHSITQSYLRFFKLVDSLLTPLSIRPDSNFAIYARKVTE